ncbi:hypothetical protein JOC37_001853 [Desulfohalotomaculum tongense]|uniref:hypothetical protein n=1 Tax=Desulforadius tongensis TaxID=1216062 RepID=UPI001957EDA6|nr:hypothetical protein [Desulforadius tongensis]MBM7855458.1 hypothetical protein [Desulforadius tongensis]
MRMKRNERSILAYFSSAAEAEEAANALKEMGISNVQVDRVSRYGVENNREINQALTGGPTQTSLTLFSSGQTSKLDSSSERVLLAADPSVSGIGAAGYGVAGGSSFLVTAVTDEQHLDQAVSIVKRHGGKI